jgi:putative hydrolase of the HAD superfamily
MTRKITAIAFDYGGVLAKMIDETTIGHMADSVHADFEHFRTALWKFRHDYDLGVLEADSYWMQVITDAQGYWPKDKIAQKEVLATLKMLDTIAYLTFNPGLFRWIRTLHAENYRCLMISNMAGETYDMLVKDTFLEPYFERVILSGWINVNKPDEKIFQEAIRKMNVPAQEILFLDDLPHNVEGARKAGLCAIQFTDCSSLERILAIEYPEVPRWGLLGSQTL